MANRQKKKQSAKKTKPTPKKPTSVQSSTYKRALFQSPDQLPKDKESQTPNSQCIQRSKRNLFTVDSSSEKKNENGKRERPVTRRVSPRKRVNRSLSFQENSQTAAVQKVPAPPPQPSVQTTLTGAHKQKMLWAVTNALREDGMGMSHELFRPCMSVMFKSCQKLWLTKVLKGEVSEGSTSENMLALAKNFTTYTIKEISLDPTSEHMALVCANILRLADSKPINNQLSTANTSKTVQERKPNEDQTSLSLSKTPRNNNSFGHLSDNKSSPSKAQESIKLRGVPILRPKQSPAKISHRNSPVIISPCRLRRRSSIVTESDLKEMKSGNLTSPENKMFHKPSPVKLNTPKIVSPKTHIPSRTTRRVSVLKTHNNHESDDDLGQRENTLVSASSQLVSPKIDQHQSSAKKKSTIIKRRESKATEYCGSDKEMKHSDELSLQPVPSEQNLVNLSSIKSPHLFNDLLKKSPIIQIVPCDLVKEDQSSPKKTVISKTSKIDQANVLGKSPVQVSHPTPFPARRVTRSSSCNNTDSTEKAKSDVTKNPLPVLVQITAKSPEKINSPSKEQCILHQKENVSLRLSHETLKTNCLEMCSSQIINIPKEINKVSAIGSIFSTSATTFLGLPCNSHHNNAFTPNVGSQCTADKCSSNASVSTSTSTIDQNNLDGDSRSQCDKQTDTSDSSKPTSYNKDSDQLSTSPSTSNTDKKSDSYYETNKENIIIEKCIPKGMNNKRVNPSQRHFSSLDNRPSNETAEAGPVNTTLKLYRMSTSGGESAVVNAGKQLSIIEYDEAPLLVPHWEESSVESDSPPSLVPHWEQQSSCSGTSASLPESIMAHWQNIPALANTSDKVMFDFEDTSYEITFPTEDDDTRASSTCAPFDLSNLIDESTSGFNSVCSTRNADSYNR